MPRIAGIDLPAEKRIDIGLTAIYGLGRKNVVAILKRAKISPAKRVKTLTNEEVGQLREAIDKTPTEGALHQRVTENIRRLKSIGSYRGLRHTHNLPARGQRTRSNARTKRGKRQTVGALKKKDSARFGGDQKDESKTEE